MSDFILLHKISARTEETTEVILRKDKIDSVYERLDGTSQLYLDKDKEINVKEKPQRIYDLLNMEWVFTTKDGKIERIK